MRRWLHLLFSIACLCQLAACGDNLSAPGAPLPPGDGGQDGGQNGRVVKGTFRLPPELAMYREVTETAWKPLPMITPTSYQFSPRAPYLITVACKTKSPNFTIVRIQQVGRTLQDGEDPGLECDHDGPYRITGSIDFSYAPGGMPQGQYYITMRYERFSSPRSISIAVANGTYDVMGFFTDRFVIRRGVQVSGDTMIMKPIDPIGEGILPIKHPFNVTNLSPPEYIDGTVVELKTQDGFLPLNGDRFPATSFSVVPNSELLPSDVQTVEVIASSERTVRTVKRKFYEGVSTEFTLPEFIHSQTLTHEGGIMKASWETLPEHDRIRAGLIGLAVGRPRPDANLHEVIVSRSFEETMGISSLVMDTDMPGFLPEWQLDLSLIYTQDLYAERDVGDDTSSTGVFDRLTTLSTSGLPIDQLRDLRSFSRGLHAP